MLLALWSAYEWVGTEPVEDNGWLGGGYSYTPPKTEKKTYDEFIDKYFEALKEKPVEIASKMIEPQKEQLAAVVVREINALDILNSLEIKMAILQAEQAYFDYLARLREQDDEACLMLLLN